MMQREITESTKLLNHRGELQKSGWAKQLLLRYDRSDIRTSPLRIKEWDYYEIINPHHGVVLLIYDIGYQARAIVKWMDFDKGRMEEEGVTLWFTRGSMNLPPSSDSGDISFEKDGLRWECLRDTDGNRHFTFRFPGFRSGVGLEGTITLSQPKGQDTIVNAIPFKRKSRFVYVQKINCMVPDGVVRIGEREYKFNKGNSSNGCLDWSRAVFPYHLKWRWCTASGTTKDTPIGFNIGYGFGTESSKNMIFYNNTGHHLDQTEYSFDKKNPDKDWVFTDNQDRLDLRMKPTFVEKSGTNYLVLKTKVLKAYGFFTGSVVLDDGRRIEIGEEDKLFGAAEAVVNYW